MGKVERAVERAKQDAKLEAALERKAKAADAARTEQPVGTPRPDPSQ